MAAREKAYRYVTPTGKKLAALVYERCKSNVERYRRSHKSVQVFFGSLTEYRARESFTIYITGRTSGDEKRWTTEFLRNWERRNKYPGHAMLTGRKKGWSQGVLAADYEGYAEQAGWEVDVEIFVGTAKAPTFDMEVNRNGEVPAEIMQCLKSTYNELHSEYG